MAGNGYLSGLFTAVDSTGGGGATFEAARAAAVVAVGRVGCYWRRK